MRLLIKAPLVAKDAKVGDSIAINGCCLTVVKRKGSLLAFERTKLIPRKAIALNLVAMMAEARAQTPDAIVDHFAARFLSVPLAAKGSSTVR